MRILTGDRPTGPLHLGHYVGSLRNRIELQEQHEQFIMIADTQALTDNAEDIGKVQRNIREVLLDYLACGIDPAKSTIFVQSQVPALFELTSIFMNYVTVSRLERNPTIRDEIKLRDFERDIPAGFLCYPVSQAADIAGFKAQLVPVGTDQLPMIEQTNEIVSRINRIAGKELLVSAKALVPKFGRLPGLDGKSKMSKSQGNAVMLGESSAGLAKAIHAMYTDSNHLKVSDPGQVEGNVVFTYLDAFDTDVQLVEDLKQKYQRGGLGDSTVKARLRDVLESTIGPIRERRAQLSTNTEYLLHVLEEGTKKAAVEVQSTLDEVKSSLGLFNFRNL